MKKIILMMFMIFGTSMLFAQFPRFKFLQIQKDTTAGSILISSFSDSNMVYSRDFFINELDSSLILFGDTIALKNSISVFTDNTITGNGLTGSPLRVDTSIIATQGDLSDYVTVAGTQTVGGAKTFTDTVRIEDAIKVGANNAYIYSDGTGNYYFVNNYKNQSGNHFVIIGDGTMSNATTVSNPTSSRVGGIAIGYNVMKNLSQSASTNDGVYNSGVGYGALENVTTGNFNTAFGHLALNKLTTGGSNAALGTTTLENATNTSTTLGIGDGALRFLTSGSDNVAIGSNSGTFDKNDNQLNTINQSVLIGRLVRPTASSFNEIVIGYGGIGLGSNTVVLGNSSITKTRLQGDVGIGESSPSAKLDVVGNTELNGGLTQSGGDVNFDSGTLFVDESDGFVGIGTDNPVGVLQVSKPSSPVIAIQNTSSITSGTRGDFAWYNLDNSTVAVIRAEAVTDNVGTHLDFHVRPVGGSLTQEMRLTSSGYLGIGTTSPTERLHSAYNVASGASGFGDGSFILKRASDGLSVANFSINTTSSLAKLSTEYSFLTFETESLERMQLTPIGLGIGTSSPASKLHIYGGDAFLGLDWTSANYETTPRQFKIASNGNNSGYITQAAYNSSSTASTTFFRSYVNAASSGALVFESGAGNFNTNGGIPASYAELLRITSAGNVGIGTDSPTSKLSVVKDGDASSIDIITYRNASGQSSASFRFARGTEASPAIVQNGDVVAEFAFLPYKGSGWANTASINAKVNGTVTSSSIPTDIIFRTDAQGQSFASGKERLIIKSDGNILMPDVYDTDVSGTRDVQINSDGKLVATSSSINSKDIVGNYNKGIDYIKKLNPIYYTYKKDDRKLIQAGFIAEEFDTIGLNEFVGYSLEGKADGINYSQLTTLTVKAIQEQQAIIESQESKIQTLESTIETLQQQMQDLINRMIIMENQ